MYSQYFRLMASFQLLLKTNDTNITGSKLNLYNDNLHIVWSKWVSRQYLNVSLLKMWPGRGFLVCKGQRQWIFYWKNVIFSIQLLNLVYFAVVYARHWMADPCCVWWSVMYLHISILHEITLCLPLNSYTLLKLSAVSDIIFCFVFLC